MIYEVIKLDGKHEFVEKPEKSRFTTNELINLIGGWFTLRWAYSETQKDSQGRDIETMYWLCSWDSACGDDAKRPPLNKEAMAAFHIEAPIYGEAIVAQSSCF